MRARARKNEPDAQAEARKIIDLDDTLVRRWLCHVATAEESIYSALP